MFNKKTVTVLENNSNETKFLKNSILINEVTKKYTSIFSDIIMEASRQPSTLGFSGISIIGTTFYDSMNVVDKAHRIKDYSSEIFEISKTQNVDPYVVTEEVTKNTVRKGIIDLTFRDAIPLMVNVGIRNSIKLNTPLKSILYFANIPGLLGLGLSEITDKLIVSHEFKQYAKEDDKSKFVGNLYYQGKYETSSYSKNKKAELKQKIITTAATSASFALLTFLSSRKKPEVRTETVVIGFSVPNSDKKSSPSTDKTVKKVTKPVIKK